MKGFEMSENANDKPASVDGSAGSDCSPDRLLGRYGFAARSAAVVVAWQAGEITEMTAAKLLGVDVIENREHVAELIAVADALLRRCQETGETVKDDLQREIIERRGFDCRRDSD